MFETTSQLERHIFRSKRNRQRKRARIHKRTVFDAARYLEIKNKCLALKKTVRVAPALMYNPLPSVERLNELLVVDFEAGSVWARVTRSRLQRGDLLGQNASGYVQVSIDGRHYKLHRLIWKMKHGCDPTGQIDHIDGNRQNNSIINLRDVTSMENCRNRCQHSSNSSGRLGVTKQSATGLWAAEIGLNGRNIKLGSYADLADAIAARECGELYLYGAVSGNREAT